LLIDPYAGLSPGFQDELFHYYLNRPTVRRNFSVTDLQAQYPMLALQRNLQILGAFAFLSAVRKKAFFSQYILPAVAMLETRMQDPALSAFPKLREMASQAAEVLCAL
jgi:aminoglycoside/choline kinase family phosphotransferase